eukprot:CAMPEP_0206254176 /NCGR_PEP_ID=MMETSP0047_2-20121206/23557_1 /ASSEMBLY_ACC=CAM_ASM_000192 /TAXON_ID=195065 /ORGANISM="Chroomonas mesostigmatica_cf, Strain CCMP1168" /LENGTH=156 /DNA_ID=CAMNT_0053680457 /DNA_START=103 /DNA_END=569 /DNA_ORIENTATION=-
MATGAGVLSASEWTLTEQLALVEAVQQYGAGMLPDFTSVGRAVKQAMAYQGNRKQREGEFYAPRKCEGKWQEMLLADDAKKCAAEKVQRKGPGEPSPAERAAELLQKIKEGRKTEIKTLITTVVAEAAQVDRDLAAIPSADQATLDRFVKEADQHP